MYSEHPAFEKPEDENAKIWRYMDFTKLVSLLDKKALYFSRLDCLSDKFEGSYPRVNIEKRNKSLDDGPIKKILPLYDREKHIKLRSQMHKAERKTFCVNSWHINNHESAAMWKLYLKSDEGIAIQSTFKRLCNSFNKEDRTIWIGKVKYIDYEKDAIPDDSYPKIYLYKRKSFEYEMELRAIALRFDPKIEHITEVLTEISQKQDPSTQGRYIDVNLEILIEDFEKPKSMVKFIYYHYYI